MRNCTDDAVQFLIRAVARGYGPPPASKRGGALDVVVVVGCRRAGNPGWLEVDGWQVEKLAAVSAGAL
jgi:hypothetical protein